MARHPPKLKLVNMALQGANSLLDLKHQRRPPCKPPQPQEGSLGIRDQGNMGEGAKPHCLCTAQSCGHKLGLSTRVKAIKEGGGAKNHRVQPLGIEEP